MELIDLYMQVARQCGQVMHDVAVRHDLTPMQAMVLARVGEGPLPTKEIAQHLRCDPSNATGLIDQLERRGLVDRSTPPDDRRKRVVGVTEAGRSVVTLLREAMTSTQSRFDRLTPDETVEFRRMLRILADDGRLDR